MERDIGPLLDEFLKPWNGVLCFHFVPVCLYVCRYTGYRALTLTKDPNFPLDGTLRHTKETHFFSFVEMSVSTRDFCFRFLPIVTLVNVCISNYRARFLQRRNIALFIVGIINADTSITVPQSRCVHDWFIALALLWHECLQTWWSMAYLSKER